MKTKHLLTALVLPALFAACTEDAFESSVNNNGANLNGQLVELGEDFAVGLTRGNGNAATRTNWHYEGKGDILYSWLPTFYTCPETSTIKAAAEEIGFAWRGEVGDAKVRTNYKFTLAGFLNVGETTPETLVCDGELAVKNGYLMEIDKANDCGIKVTTTGTAPNTVSTVNLLQFDKTSKKMTDQSKDLVYKDGTYTIAGKNLAAALDESKLDVENGDPYVRNGIFTTDNGTIFKGDYIVYFPYDPDFAEIDYLPATTPTIFTQDDAEKNRVAHLAGKTFGYGAATIVEGGRMAESFNTQNLSSFIDLKVTAESGAKFGKLSKIILVDEAANAKGFIKKVGLDASKIAAGQTGTALYVAETQEYEPTIVLNIVNGSDESTTLGATAKEFTVATLPTTVGTLVAYLMNEDGLCLRKQIATNWTMTPGKGKQFEVKIGKTEEAKERLAVDTKTLIESISAAGAGTKAATVRTLGNITLDKNVEIELAGYDDTDASTDHKKGTLTAGDLFGLSKTTSVYVAQNVTVTGTGTITVPADVALTFKAVDKKTLSFENPIVIENAGCCGDKPGKVIILSANGKEGTVLFKSDVTNYGAMYLANNSVDNMGTTVTFNGAFKNLVNDYTEEGRDAFVYCYGAKNSVINFNGDVENEGTIEIANKAVELENAAISLFENEKAVAVNAKNIVNDGTINVGKYTSMVVAGTVNNNGYIGVESAGTRTVDESDEKDGNLEVGKGAAINNAGTVENYGVINLRGALKNTDADADIIDHVGCQFGGNKADATVGEYICDVEDEDVDEDGDRLGYALGDNMPTTTVRFIGESDTKGNSGKGYIYNLFGYNLKKINFIVAATSNVELNGTNNKGVAQKINMGGTLIVNKGSQLDLSEIMLTVDGKITVNGVMNVQTTVDGATTSESAQALIAQSDVNVNGTFDVAQFVNTDLNANMAIAKDAKATFNYASYTDIANTLSINGDFIRVVSTGGVTANPAQVWVGDWTEGSSANIPNGLPQKR